MFDQRRRLLLAVDRVLQRPGGPVQSTLLGGAHVMGLGVYWEGCGVKGDRGVREWRRAGKGREQGRE